MATAPTVGLEHATGAGGLHPQVLLHGAGRAPDLPPGPPAEPGPFEEGVGTLLHAIAGQFICGTQVLGQPLQGRPGQTRRHHQGCRRRLAGGVTLLAAHFFTVPRRHGRSA